MNLEYHECGLTQWKWGVWFADRNLWWWNLKAKVASGILEFTSRRVGVRCWWVVDKASQGRTAPRVIFFHLSAGWPGERCRSSSSMDGNVAELNSCNVTIGVSEVHGKDEVALEGGCVARRVRLFCTIWEVVAVSACSFCVWLVKRLGGSLGLMLPHRDLDGRSVSQPLLCHFCLPQVSWKKNHLSQIKYSWISFLHWQHHGIM
jgi:hypothetical protein